MQRKILVPIDFSRTATAAADLAVEMAPLFNAQIHFFHKINLPPKWEEYDDDQKAAFPASLKAIRAMSAQFEKMKKRYAATHVKTVYTYSGSDMVPTVSRYIEENDIYMIVMGSQGATGLKEWAFGSNAQKTVRHAHCPVLVVKQPMSQPQFKQLVFASDFKDEARKPFERLVEFGKRFGSVIHLLHIAAYPRFEVGEEDVARMESFAANCDLPCTIHGVGDFDIEQGIGYFMKKVEADLLGIAHSSRTSLQRLVSGSVSESLVNHVELPVLVLKTRENDKEIPADLVDPATAKDFWTIVASNG